MLKPKMRRNRADELETRPMPGIHFDRNPGVFCLYETETYRRFMTSTGPLCQLGQPQRIRLVDRGAGLDAGGGPGGDR